jgi:hypothetical protein
LEDLPEGAFFVFEDVCCGGSCEHEHFVSAGQKAHDAQLAHFESLSSQGKLVRCLVCWMHPDVATFLVQQTKLLELGFEIVYLSLQVFLRRGFVSHALKVDRDILSKSGSHPEVWTLPGIDDPGCDKGVDCPIIPVVGQVH